MVSHVVWWDGKMAFVSYQLVIKKYSINKIVKKLLIACEHFVKWWPMDALLNVGKMTSVWLINQSNEGSWRKTRWSDTCCSLLSLFLVVVMEVKKTSHGLRGLLAISGLVSRPYVYPLWVEPERIELFLQRGIFGINVTWSPSSSYFHFVQEASVPGQNDRTPSECLFSR